jgi:signal transduction histidine kinase/CheY-like chemotaxis protein
VERSVAEPQSDTPSVQTYRGRLFRKYAVAFVIVVAGALLSSGLVELYFSYQETQSALIHLQQEQAVAAASNIQEFVAEAERQMTLVIRPRWANVAPSPDPGVARGSGRGGTPNQRLNDYLRLLRQLPAATEIRYLDSSGREQLSVSRLARNIVGSRADFSADPRFLGSQSGQPYYGPVYFENESEPFMSLAILDRGPGAGVNLVELRLKPTLDAVADLRVGTAGYAYVLDGAGRVLAHPDGALVVQAANFSSLPQVRAALDEPLHPDAPREAAIAEDTRGRRILSAHQLVSPPGWTVFVEQSLEEVYAPVYALVNRTALLLVLGLAISIGTSLFLAGRMVTPIQALQSAASRLGAGALDQRIKIRTHDELEALAEEFNRMAAQLEESYADLERKVDVRTRDLAAALEAIEVQSKQLEAASQHKSEFLASMSHELRTPLNAIIGFSQLLVNRRFGELNAEQAEYLADILDSGRHLLALINDILDLSKVEAGRMELEPGRFSLRAALENGLTMVGERASERRIGLMLDVQADLAPIDGDERKIKQVIFNLLSNAVKFTPGGGRVEVVARQVDNEVHVAVRDTGVGIAAEDLERIFEEFQQGRSGATSTREGTGLGLTLARKFVELHGGRLWVASEVGTGSTFTFSLPISLPTEAAGVPGGVGLRRATRAEARSADGPAAVDSPPRPLILVVEDNRSSVDLLEVMLGDEGFAVAVAHDGENGLEMAGRLQPAAIVLDVLLPGFDGWEFLSRAKADPTLAAIPVIVVSILHERMKGLALGAADYLVKPVNRDDLLATLRRRLSPLPAA